MTEAPAWLTNLIASTPDWVGAASLILFIVLLGVWFAIVTRDARDAMDRELAATRARRDRQGQGR